MNPNLTTDIISAAARDAATRRAKVHGRESWDKADYQFACAESERLYQALDRICKDGGSVAGRRLA